MNNKHMYSVIIIFSLLIISYFVPLAFSQEASPSPTPSPTPTPAPISEPENISVALLSPIHNYTINSFNVSFVFVPAINGTANKFEGADLFIDGNIVGSNHTAIEPYVNNTIYHEFSSNGTYLWNVKVRNGTTVVSATNDFNLTVSVYLEPEPTPTPSPSLSVTPTPTSVPTVVPTVTPTAATPTASPTPNPKPTENGIGTWTIVIIAIVIIAVVGAVILLLLTRKGS